MYSIELMKMIKDMLDGNTGANDFSFDFPARMSFVYDEFLEENPKLCDYLGEEMPDLCSWFDPHNTGCEGTIDEKVFREKVEDIYIKALPLILSMNMKKIS